MLTPTVGRAVRSTGSISAASACTLSRPAALGAVQQSFSRPSHQRRLSSSKASIPPDGSNTNGPSSPQQTPASANKAPSRKVTGRSSKKRAVAPALNVPHVPPTDYLQKPEVKISSFFSLHRPISLTTPIPPVSTNTSFDSIFKARALNDRKQVSNNIQVISSGIESLEAALNLDDSRQAAEDISIQANVEVQHMDGPPQASLDQLMARLVPFRPPPVPELDQGSFESSALGMIEEAPATSPAKQRAWSTAVVVTESTDSSGNRTYSASTAPMVEIPVPDAGNGQEMDEMDIRQPFLERMTRRQVTHNRRRDNLGRPDMLAISVKRQRKLKMKKHKYKKLMKRTRLERKKLDRL